MKWVFKKILFPEESSGQSQNRKAFTLIEVTVALIVFGMITATVLVVINKAIETVVMWQTKMQAFEIARENMEKILAQSSVTDFVEYGMSETNPDITWETMVSSFYEPLTNQMWMRAVCTAQFVDSEGEEQKIELTHWLAGLNKEQIRQILEQKQRESEYQAATGTLLNEPSENVVQQGQLSVVQQAKLLQQAEQFQQQAEQMQQQANQLQQQAEQMQQQAEQMQQQANQQQAEQLQQQAEQVQQQAEQMQQQAEQVQQQAEQQQQANQDKSYLIWKEVEKYIGPPPAGYNSWKDVPSKQFWGAMMKWFGEK